MRTKKTGLALNTDDDAGRGTKVPSKMFIGTNMPKK
jgi:hypothetical protein